MGQIDDETAVVANGDGTYTTHLSAAWSIGANPNGGYAVLPVLRALGDVAGRTDPTSLTVHYLRPALGDAPGTITTEVVRSGRTGTNVAATLVQEGRPRLTVAAILGDLAVPASEAPDPGLAVAAPAIPPPEDCVDRADLRQGVELPLLSRVDVRVRRDQPAADGATVDGWIRLRDGSPPAAPWLVLFADAFPPAVHAAVEQVGWVPTLELTVHVRRRPAPGWVQARMTCDDVHGGRMVETGSLWDSSGALVARSRQLGMLLPPAPR
jgi:acyl-CoA thioesterase